MFPGQYGWRSGRRRRHRVTQLRTCPAGQVATCLYAFGGTTSFSGQRVGTFADELPSASVLDRVRRTRRFMSTSPQSSRAAAKVYVGGRRWSEVDNLAAAGPEGAGL